MCRAVAGAVFLLLVLTLPIHAQDLRDQYSTQSLEAAKLIDQTIQLVQAKKPRDAVKASEAAVKADPQCQMAHYWRAIALNDVGDIEASIEAYQTALSDKVVRKSNISASAAFNLALTNARLKEYEEACIWFTRAIIEDPDNKHKERGKAYRNLGITLRNLNRPFGAAMAIAFAYDDKAANTPTEMVRDFFKAVGNQETCRVLHFRETTPKLEKRGMASKLAAIPMDGAITEAIDFVLADPAGKYVVIWPRKTGYYHLVDTTTDKLSVKKIEMKAALDFPTLSEGFLYGVSGSPTAIEKIEVATGKTIETHRLTEVVPTSLAVLPTQKRAYFGSEREVHELNLTTGKVQKTSIPGQVVVADPRQEFVFSILKPERAAGGGGPIIINGKPVFFQSTITNWQQAILFKSRITRTGLLLAEVRENVASNTRQFSVSPDGQWVAAAGGGGWRPNAKTQGFGYGVAVFATANLDHVQGFFKTDAYPTGVAFNPVSSQVVGIRGKDAKVYHLADANEPLDLQGKYSGPAAWSGNGRYLFLATENSGVTAFVNELTPAETTFASTWAKSLVPVAAAPPAIVKTAAATSFDPVAGYDAFDIAKAARAQIAKNLEKVIAGKRDARPGPWSEFATYQDAKVNQVIDDVRDPISRKEEIGIAIFKLKKIMKTHPNSIPAKFYLAEALRHSNQPENAEPLYIDVIRRDSGRTNLSSLALNSLATLLGDREDSLPALHCLVESLYLDRANPTTINQAMPILTKLKFTAEAEQLSRLSSGTAPVTHGELPKLGAPPTLKKLTASEIYQKSVWSVVLIKTNTGSGSGVAMGRGDIIVTNKHVVGGADSVEVYPFLVKDRAPVKLPMIRGQVIFRSPTEDIAVLKLAKAPDHLVPLAVASVSPSPGDKVIAIGSPGLGSQILEQTISEGIVSSKSRRIEGADYLQHSAPVNPGNSGGPLLDENGHVVGIVTLNARLANVSFAIPVETLRKIFSSP